MGTSFSRCGIPILVEGTKTDHTSRGTHSDHDGLADATSCALSKRCGMIHRQHVRIGHHAARPCGHYRAGNRSSCKTRGEIRKRHGSLVGDRAPPHIGFPPNECADVITQMGRIACQLSSQTEHLLVLVQPAPNSVGASSLTAGTSFEVD